MGFKTTVPISKEMYETSGSLLYVCRLLGFFPASVVKSEKRYQLKWSLGLTLYSYTFGIILITFTYIGYIADMNVTSEKSIRLKTETDVYVIFTDVTAVMSVLFFAIFINPLKWTTFHKFVQCFNQIDPIIPPINTRKFQLMSIVGMCCILTLIIIGITSEANLFIDLKSEDKVSPDFVIKCYAAYWLSYPLLLLYHIIYWHLVRCIHRRIKLLRKSIKYWAMNNWSSKAAFSKGVKEKQIYKIQNGQDYPLTGEIEQFNNAYGRLCDSVKYLNELLGVNNGVVLVGILWHLILTPYYVVVSMTGRDRDIRFTVLQLYWTIIHVVRLLLLVQPCHACVVEVDRIKDLISDMLFQNRSERIKAQLQDFAVALQLRKFEFHASGIVTIDRYLITSMGGAVVTYLIILIQLAGDNEEHSAIHIKLSSEV